MKNRTGFPVFFLCQIINATLISLVLEWGYSRNGGFSMILLSIVIIAVFAYLIYALIHPEKF
ncbi:K(+)-transporting ATPase subunit F [Erysipelothrix aquatica]|uniref:K(+)-transporting ATPase subunit F n=1 Tax=Erysipelothrix aquatica TaxID=2683714 RepID=UPI0019156D02